MNSVLIKSYNREYFKKIGYNDEEWYLRDLNIIAITIEKHLYFICENEKEKFDFYCCCFNCINSIFIN